MGWVRISDDFYDHEKFADVGVLGDAMWIRGLAYANRNLTDGRVTKRAANGLIDTSGLGKYQGNYGGRDAEAQDGIDELVGVGLWHVDGHDCESCPQPGPRAYYIHDYLKYQPSKEEVEARAQERSESGKKGAAKRWRKADPMADPMATAMADPMAKPWLNDAPNPNPNPNRPRLNKSSPVVNRESYPQGPDEGESVEALCEKQAKAMGVDFGKVKTAIGKACGRFPDPTGVMRIIATVMERAKQPVKSPTGIVLAAIRNDWAEWQQFLDEEVA